MGIEKKGDGNAGSVSGFALRSSSVTFSLVGVTQLALCL